MSDAPCASQSVSFHNVRDQHAGQLRLYDWKMPHRFENFLPQTQHFPTTQILCYYENKGSCSTCTFRRSVQPLNFEAHTVGTSPTLVRVASTVRWLSMTTVFIDSTSQLQLVLALHLQSKRRSLSFRRVLFTCSSPSSHFVSVGAQVMRVVAAVPLWTVPSHWKVARLDSARRIVAM